MKLNVGTLMVSELRKTNNMTNVHLNKDWNDREQLKVAVISSLAKEKEHMLWNCHLLLRFTLNDERSVHTVDSFSHEKKSEDVTLEII